MANSYISGIETPINTTSDDQSILTSLFKQISHSSAGSAETRDGWSNQATPTTLTPQKKCSNLDRPSHDLILRVIEEQEAIQDLELIQASLQEENVKLLREIFLLQAKAQRVKEENIIYNKQIMAVTSVNFHHPSKYM